MCFVLGSLIIINFSPHREELAKEEQRLDKMMEQQRILGLKEEEKHKEEEALKNQRYLQALLHQIQENETERIHEAERKEEVAGSHVLLILCTRNALSCQI